MIYVVFFLVYAVCLILATFDAFFDLAILPFLNFESTFIQGVVNFLPVLAVAFIVGYTIQAVTGQYEGIVWDYKIKSPMCVKIFRCLGVIGGLVCVIWAINNKQVLGSAIGMFVEFFVGFIKILFAGKVLEFLLLAAKIVIMVFAVVGMFLLGNKQSVKVGLRLTAFSVDFLKLGEHKIFKDFDTYVNDAKSFLVDGTQIMVLTFNDERIYLVYEDYGLSKLERTVTAAESKKVAAFKVGLVGLYFYKKYGNDFKFKVRKTLVAGAAGTAGTQVTVVTSSGVYSGTTGGTDSVPDKTVFDGYWFERR